MNSVSLHELDKANANLRDLLTLVVKPNKLSGKGVNSLLGNIGDLSKGPFVLAFVPVENTLRHFIAIPKELVSTRISTPDNWPSFTSDQKKYHPMKYSYWPGAERICTISEPFLTPVVQHVLSALGGHGVPDYPEEMRSVLKQIVDDFSNIPGSTKGIVSPALPQPPAAIA